MRVLVSGSTGLIGSALVPVLTAGGHRVTRLVRAQPRTGEDAVHWDPATGAIDQTGLEGFDAVVHLAGENLAARRWTPEQKARIRDSRVRGTSVLCEALAQLRQPPKVLLSASAVGYYGDRGAEILREHSPPGSGFLAEVAQEWEAAAEPARVRGIRVVHPRTGVVLTPAGGALAKMLLPFRLGLGGTIGTGWQYMSWIALDDLLGAFLHAVATETLAGPVNVVAPNPVTNREFTDALSRVLSRPAFFAVPKFVLRLALGEMADAALFWSERVLPDRLLASGFRFRFPELEGALRHLLGRDRPAVRS